MSWPLRRSNEWASTAPWEGKMKAKVSCFFFGYATVTCVAFNPMRLYKTTFGQRTASLQIQIQIVRVSAPNY